jgi:D-serine deaminase-like pyridoxal phosphate-dependent protein
MSANSASVGRPKPELETPALCLDLQLYRRNVRRMVDFIIGQCGIAWRPHMKGQKAPELAHELLAAGAIGVTCATVYEAEGLAEAGVPDILVANQVAGRHKLARLARLAGRARILTATDSVAHLELLSAAALAEGVTLPVLVELDVGMNRCGVLPGEPAVELARAACRTPGIHFAGLMAWEGHTLLFEGEEKRQAIHDSIRSLVNSAEMCRAAGLPVERVSCSGSGTFLHSGELQGVTEIQAGGGAFCDLNYRKWGLENEYAITVVTRIVSRPTPTRIIVDGGFKTMSSQHGPPRPIGLGPLKSLVLSAEHGILELEQPDTERQVGDLVEFIPGYTDSTVCLHDELCVLEEGRVSAVWGIPGRSGRR